MMNFKVIGTGAAGNKAAINLIENGFDKKNVLLINSTSKDISENYKDISLIFGNGGSTLGGCGKERDVGKRLILQDMKSGKFSLDNIADPNTNCIIIVSSTEGGTGSSSTPIIAKYIKEVLGIPVITVLFFGFNTDVRGMQNSIEISQELEDSYGVIGISNEKFLEISNGNRIKAEQLANDYFVDIIKILSGSTITPGNQNIDDTDLYKLVVTPGYMVVDKCSIGKIKNIDQYNRSITSAIDESKSVGDNRGAKRIGIIYDAPERIYDYIDFNHEVIKNRYGIPYEMFMHVQDTDNPSVSWIVSGLPLPISEIKEIYDNYLKASNSVNKSKDVFFDSVMDMKGNEEDSQFNMFLTSKANNKAKSNFFADFGLVDKKEDKTPVKTKTTEKEY